MLVAAGLAASGSEARRKIAEGAVRIDGEKVSDAAMQLSRRDLLLQLGPRRAARVVARRRRSPLMACPVVLRATALAADSSASVNTISCRA